MNAEIAQLPAMIEPPEGLATLRQARQGDREAFAQLVRAHQARVFSVALRLSGNRADAEELAQDAFVQLHAALAGIESPEHLRHWLLRTVSHRAIDRLRQRERRPRLVPMDAASASLASADPARDVDHLAASRLQALLLQLAPDARAVVLLRFQEDLDPADIATLLTMPLNTVKSHLRRSLDWLRAQCAGVEYGI